MVSESSWAASFAIDCPPFIKGFKGSDTMSQTLTAVTFGRYTTGIETPLQVPYECHAQKPPPFGKFPVTTTYMPLGSGGVLPKLWHTSVTIVLTLGERTGGELGSGASGS